MALRKCTECGTEVSDKAGSCPKCGAPQNQKRGLSGLRMLLIGVIALPIVIAITHPESESAAPSASKPVGARAPDPNEGRNMMAAVAGRSLRKSMRDPDSFKLEQALAMDKAICFTYRAHNGFGGVNVGRAVLVLKTAKMATSDQDGFAGVWNTSCGNKTGDDITKQIANFVSG